MQELGEGDFLDGRMDVQHAIEARAEDTFEFQQHDLRLEGLHTVDRSLGRAEHEAGEDVFFLDSTQADPDLVPAAGRRDFLLGLPIQGRDGDFLPVGHHEILVLLLDLAGFDFPFDHRAQVAVFAVDGHHEGGLDFALQGFEVVEVFEQGRAVVIGCKFLGHAVFDPLGGLGGDGHKVDVGFSIADLTVKEVEKLVTAFFVSVVGPFDRGVVHLVDDDDELVDALGFGKDGVFAGLAALFEAGFVLAFSGRDDEDANVGLRGATDHVGHEGFVTGGIEDGVSPRVGLEESTPHFYSLSF